MDEQPKRRGPKPVDPIEINKVRYEVVPGAKSRGFPQDGGVVAAIDTATQRELWTLVVYKTNYDSNEEIDVQERYITRLSVAPGGLLRVENEAKKAFLIDLQTREVKETSGN